MYYNRNAQGKSLLAHFIMAFLTEKAQSAVATTETGGYLIHQNLKVEVMYVLHY